MKKRKNWLWIVAVVLVLVGVGGYVMLRGAAQRTALAAEGTAVETAVVERGTLRATVEGSGSLTPQREVAVTFESSGKVVAVLVDEGDFVAEGDTLACLDDADAQQSLSDVLLQVEQAEVSLASAQLKLDDLLEWKPDENAVALAQANLDAAESDYAQVTASDARTGDQMASVRIKLKQAQEALADAEENYRTAWDSGRDWELDISYMKARLENEREQTANALERAKDDLALAQANYNLEAARISDNDVKSAWSKVVNAQVSLDREKTSPDESDIENARIQVQQAEISLKQAQLRLASAQRTVSETMLIAPVAGTVTVMDLEVGQMVGNSQTAVQLADLTTLVVEIGLDESDIVQVAVGQPAIVTLDAFDDLELHGAITHLAPTARAQSGVVLYDVTVALDATSLPARAGMTADVEVITNSADGVLLVPLKAVRSMDGGTYVQRQLKAGETAADAIVASGSQNTTTLVQSGFTLVPVELGVVTDSYAEVLSGLEEGDVVGVVTSSRSNTDAFTPPGMGMMMGGR